MSKTDKNNAYYQRKSLRAYWSIHVEAWLRSGVTRRSYCNDHGLHPMTMKRWLTALETPLPKRRRTEKKFKKLKTQRFPAERTKAFFAFWLMHIEALRDSGLTATAYAHAHHLPVRKLRKLRRRFEHTPPAADWREMLHPKVFPSVKSTANLRYKLRYDGASEAATKSDSTITPASAADRPRKRRQFTDKQKLAIVAEAADSTVTVSAIARRHGVIPAMIFRWREAFGFNQPKSSERALLVTARVVTRRGRGRPKQTLSLVLPDLLPMPDGSIIVELADGRRVYAPAGSDPESVRQYIVQQEQSS